MNFFDFITKGNNKEDGSGKPDELADKSKQKAPRSSRHAKTRETQTTQQENDNSKNTIDMYHPKSYDEVADVIDGLLAGKPAIVYLTELSENTAQRVIDLLSGALYAINGNMGVIEKDIYIITPSGIRTN